MNFELTENAIPSVVEVEDRHVEYEQWIAHPPAPLEHFPPIVREASSRSFHSCFLSYRESATLILILELIRSVSYLRSHLAGMFKEAWMINSSPVISLFEWVLIESLSRRFHPMSRWERFAVGC